MPEQLLTTAEVAKRLKRSKRWIQDIILRGKLPAQMMARTYVVRLKDVERYEHLPRGQAAKKATRKKVTPDKKKRRGNGALK